MHNDKSQFNTSQSILNTFEYPSRPGSERYFYARSGKLVIPLEEEGLAEGELPHVYTDDASSVWLKCAADRGELRATCCSRISNFSA